jgi:hypothetical protein
MHLSSENKAKLDKANELMAQLSTRMDALFAKRAKADAEKAQRRKADQIDPAALPLTAATPPTRPDNNFLEIPPWEPPAWFPTNYLDGYLPEEREELRQGALSKERI